MARTYRVRGIPPGWDADRLTEFLAAETNHTDTPRIGSIAPEIHGRSQTATINFSDDSTRPRGQSRLPASSTPSRPQTITIDDKFLGITTLYTPPPQDHRVDIIALSGLGGHAFGSFKERDGDHMWIRDELPYDLTINNKDTSRMGRVMIYGYESTVEGSDDFQNLEDLALSLRDSLLPLVSTASNGSLKPVVFIAHSLGGLLLKQMLVTVSRSERQDDANLLQMIYGVAFFGVPHSGMDIASLISMVTDRPNRPLIESLSHINSQILTTLRRDFENVLGEKGGSEIVCFYETRASPTAQKDEEGKWKMGGPKVVLVTKASATHGRHWEDGLDHICAIARTHSEMVKFGPQDHEYEKVLPRLLDIARRAHLTPKRRNQNQQINTSSQPETAYKTHHLVPHSERTDSGVPLSRSQKPYRYLPFYENKRFVGRTSIIKTLEQKLFGDDGQATRRVAIAGLGGVGKTQVALHIAHRTFQHKPDWHVFWLPALSIATFEQACKTIVQMVGLEGADKENAKELLQRYLESDASGCWLLIVDNADDEDVVEGSTLAQEKGITHFLPRSERGRILFTTRAQRTATRLVQAETVHLLQMEEDEARALLSKSLRGVDPLLASEKHTAKLLEILSNLPLAIVQAAAYLNETRASISEYIRLLQNTEQDMVELLETEFIDNTRYDGGQNAVARTWTVSFEQIRKNPDAALLLSFIAQVESKAIPRSMLPPVGSEQRMTRAIGLLCGYSFMSIREDGTTYDMHRLVHLASRVWVNEQDTSSKQKREVLVHLRRVFSTDRWEERERWREYLPHVLKAIKVNGEADNWSADECSVGYWAGRCLHMEGRSREAIKLLGQVVAIEERTLAETHPGRLASQHELAGIYQADGQINKAIELLEQVVAIRDRTLAETHPDRLTSQHALARAYQADSQVKKAIELLEQVVVIRDRILAETHLSRLASQHELAGIYQADGQINKAIELLEQVVAIKERTLTEIHPSRLASQHALARAYLADGQINKAIELLEQVVIIQDRTLAETHPSRLTSQHTLAGAYQADSQINKAIELLEQVVAIRDRTLAETHPSRLASQHELARAYQADSQIKKAIELLEQVVAIKERTLAETHPSRLTSQHALARAYHADSQINKAIELLEQVVAIRDRILAETHPSRLASQHELARAYQADSQIKKAIELLEQVVAIQERILAETHPDRLASQYTLAQAYQADGQVKKAIKLLEQVVAI